MITIKNFMYAVTGKIHPGQKIMVMNEDSEAHTVTADSGNAFDVAVPASSTATVTAPMKPGTYKFHCNIHSNMHGVLTVG
ncbi:MAG TPA: cupredoxin domain-containing protein [Jatrophihabitantaceae bacterium]|jgi:plastocyanin|nr:cupredoxin domain-containing protein [Jatrophihabitantaceae bacterium]